MTSSQEHHEASKKGCFSAILQRFLCAGGLPTHPSSDNEESSFIRNNSNTTNTTPAGVVARLMGLDSFPNSPKLTLMQKSRSLGSLDHLLPKQPHPPITASLSFREVPTTIFLHNIRLTPIQQTKPINMKETVRVKKRQNVKLVKNGEEQVSKIRRRRVVNGAYKKKLDDEHHTYKSRSKTYNHPLPKTGKRGRKEKKKTSVLKRRESEDSCIKVLKEVCRLTMVEIEGAAWVDTKVVDRYNVQQLIYEIGQQILQLLVYEVVDELCSSR